MCPAKVDAVEKRFCLLERTTLIENRHRIRMASSFGRDPDHSVRRSAVALRSLSGRAHHPTRERSAIRHLTRRRSRQLWHGGS
jgi:hypothetical protein